MATNSIRGLLKKAIVFQWLPEHQAEMDFVKSLLTSPMLAHYYDPTLSTVLLTDAWENNDSFRRVPNLLQQLNVITLPSSRGVWQLFGLSTNVDTSFWDAQLPARHRPPTFGRYL